MGKHAAVLLLSFLLVAIVSSSYLDFKCDMYGDDAKDK
jgi:hypothetical protein